MDGIEFPAKVMDIECIEKMNPGLFINAFGYESKSLYPLRVSDQPQSAINLLLFGDGTTQHWVWIKNMSPQLTNGANHRHYICFRCLHLCRLQETLDRHLLYCKEHPMARVEIGKPGAKICFKNYQKRLPAPYVIYADCEALIEPMTEPEKIGSSTEQHNRHVACPAAYIVVRSDGVVINRFEYRGEDAMMHFLLALEEEEERICDDLKDPAVMIINAVQEAEFDAATKCWICDRPLNDDRVRDHCHVTGAYRGPAHSRCNLMLRIVPYKTKILVFLHNLKGYDSHHIISQLGRMSCDEKTYEDKNGKERVSAIVIISDGVKNF